MRPILICPAERPEVQLLCAAEPLSNVPLMGRSVLENWLSHLACQGIKETLVVTSDRPDMVEAMVGKGTKWGMRVEVAAEPVELAPEQAVAKYENAGPFPGSETGALVIDHLPGFPEHPLFASYSSFFAGLQLWMPRARTPDRLGVRELKPGVWVGLHGHISPKAELFGPCWLGDRVVVGPGAVIGPESVVESGAFIESDARVEQSYVGPGTFIGKYVRVKDFVACGSMLANWRTNLETKVADAFLMCSLRSTGNKRVRFALTELLAEFCAAWKEDQSLWQHALFLKRGNRQRAAVNSTEFRRAPDRQTRSS